MQVILLERIEKLGQMGDVVKVKPGFARNYLLPQGKARRATAENLKLFEQQRAQLEAENLKQRDEAQKVAGKLEGLTVVLIRQAGESGQLYGSVNARDLAEAVTTAGFTVTRNQIVMDNVIKALGLHSVRVRLHPEVTAKITANVARSEAEAERLAEQGHVLSAEEERALEDAAAEAREATLKELSAEEEEDGEGASESEATTTESKESPPA